MYENNCFLNIYAKMRFCTLFSDCKIDQSPAGFRRALFSIDNNRFFLPLSNLAFHRTRSKIEPSIKQYLSEYCLMINEILDLTFSILEIHSKLTEKKILNSLSDKNEQLNENISFGVYNKEQNYRIIDTIISKHINLNNGKGEIQEVDKSEIETDCLEIEEKVIYIWNADICTHHRASFSSNMPNDPVSCHASIKLTKYLND